MRNTAKWKTWLRENADLITQVYTTDDIRRAKTENKTGIILGWQNSSGIEDRLDTLALFHELGLRIVQLTYNTQNLVGCGCYESRDSGLSDYGRDVLAEMIKQPRSVDRFFQEFKSANAFWVDLETALRGASSAKETRCFLRFSAALVESY